MSRITRSVIQLCALLAASASLGRPAPSNQAEACASCTTPTTCERTYGGVTSCGVGVDGKCFQSPDVCQPKVED